MKTVQGDIWEIDADWICIPTNGFLKRDGTCPMGPPHTLAGQAKRRYFGIDRTLGDRIKTRGNHVHTLLKHSGRGKEVTILSFPTKHDWRDPADLDLITNSCKELRDFWVGACFTTKNPPIVALPQVGCGVGRLKWTQVEPILREFLREDEFLVVSLT